MKRLIYAAMLIPFLSFAGECPFPVKAVDALKTVGLKPTKVEKEKEDKKTKVIYNFRKEVSDLDDPNPEPPLSLQINNTKNSKCPEKILVSYYQYSKASQLNKDNIDRAYKIYSLFSDNSQTIFENKLSRLNEVPFFENDEKDVSVKFSKTSDLTVIEFHQ